MKKSTALNHLWIGLWSEPSIIGCLMTDGTLRKAHLNVKIKLENKKPQTEKIEVSTL